MTSIAEMGRELSALQEAANNADVKHLNSPQHDAIMRRIYAIEDLITESRANNTNDAFAQIILAAGHLATVNECAWAVGGGEDEALRERAVKAARLDLMPLLDLTGQDHRPPKPSPI